MDSEFYRAAFYLSRLRGLFHDAFVQYALQVVKTGNKDMSGVMQMLNRTLALYGGRAILPIKNGESVDKKMKNLMEPLVALVKFEPRYVQTRFVETLNDLTFTFYTLETTASVTPTAFLYAASHLGQWIDEHN